MTLATIISRARDGMHAPEVRVEVHLSNGLPAFNLVGLPETSVKEAKERVRSAIINAGFEFPMRRITVNLAPADLPKQGGRYDIPIAIGILAACGEVPMASISDREFVGELALTGSVRPCQGLLPVIIASGQSQRELIIPYENGADNLLAENPNVALAQSLHEITAYLHGQIDLPAYSQSAEIKPATPTHMIQMEHIIGQVQAKKAIEIAAAGAHNVLMLGPPGTGKTMLAHALMGLMPEISQAHALEVATLHALAGCERAPIEFLSPPYRSPHHTCSAASLVGGGTLPMPGEISLAHHGTLFLDELPEFPRKVLDCLREPLETGEIMISRAKSKCTFPAQFQLIAAMNPSPCGHHDPKNQGNVEQVKRYISRLSGPLLDRFDLSVEVPKLPLGSLTETPQPLETSADIKKRILRTRERQLKRQSCLNSALSSHQIKELHLFQQKDLVFLEQTVEKLKLSIRSFHRIQRVALTLADLEQSNQVTRTHLAQALGFRAMDHLIRQVHQN